MDSGLKHVCGVILVFLPAHILAIFVYLIHDRCLGCPANLVPVKLHHGGLKYCNPDTAKYGDRSLYARYPTCEPPNTCEYRWLGMYTCCTQPDRPRPAAPISSIVRRSTSKSKKRQYVKPSTNTSENSIESILRRLSGGLEPITAIQPSGYNTNRFNGNLNQPPPFIPYQPNTNSVLQPLNGRQSNNFIAQPPRQPYMSAVNGQQVNVYAQRQFAIPISLGPFADPYAYPQFRAPIPQRTSFTVPPVVPSIIRAFYTPAPFRAPSTTTVPTYSFVTTQPPFRPPITNPYPTFRPFRPPITLSPPPPYTAPPFRAPNPVQFYTQPPFRPAITKSYTFPPFNPRKPTTQVFRPPNAVTQSPNSYVHRPFRPPVVQQSYADSPPVRSPMQMMQLSASYTATEPNQNSNAYSAAQIPPQQPIPAGYGTNQATQQVKPSGYSSGPTVQQQTPTNDAYKSNPSQQTPNRQNSPYEQSTQPLITTPDFPLLSPTKYPHSGYLLRPTLEPWKMAPRVPWMYEAQLAPGFEVVSIRCIMRTGLLRRRVRQQKHGYGLAAQTEPNKGGPILEITPRLYFPPMNVALGFYRNRLPLCPYGSFMMRTNMNNGFGNDKFRQRKKPPTRTKKNRQQKPKIKENRVKIKPVTKPTNKTMNYAPGNQTNAATFQTNTTVNLPQVAL